MKYLLYVISSLDSRISSGPNSIYTRQNFILKNNISQQLSDIFNMPFSTQILSNIEKIIQKLRLSNFLDILYNLVFDRNTQMLMLWLVLLRTLGKL